MYKYKFELITNGCDISEYEKHWEMRTIKNTKFTMVYSGAMADSRNPLRFLDVLAELKKNGVINNENFQIKFIGMLDQNTLAEILNKNLLDIIYVILPLVREEFISCICNADLLLVINYQVKTVIPGKIYDYWCAKKPVLLLDSSDSMAAQIVNENNLGAVKAPYDVKGICDIITHFFLLRKKDSMCADINVKNLYHYAREKLTEKLICNNSFRFFSISKIKDD